MGNLIALLTHCGRGTKAIVSYQSHTNRYEAGGASALGGIILAAIGNRADGELDSLGSSRELERQRRSFRVPSLVVLENTHNRCGGSPVKLSHIAEVRRRRIRSARFRCISTARASSTRPLRSKPPKEIASHDDTVTFCLSKGFGCPSVRPCAGATNYCACASDSEGARWWNAASRNNRGSGNRRADRDGRSPGRGSSECARARAGTPLVAGINVRQVANRTNMVDFDIDGDADASRRFAAAMKERGVLISPRDSTSFSVAT